MTDQIPRQRHGGVDTGRFSLKVLKAREPSSTEGWNDDPLDMTPARTVQFRPFWDLEFKDLMIET